MSSNIEKVCRNMDFRNVSAIEEALYGMDDSHGMQSLVDSISKIFEALCIYEDIEILKSEIMKECYSLSIIKIGLTKIVDATHVGEELSSSILLLKQKYGFSEDAKNSEEYKKDYKALLIKYPPNTLQ